MGPVVCNHNINFVVLYEMCREWYTVTASASCLARGVDHLCPASAFVELEVHLAPEARQRGLLNGMALRESCLAVRGRLLRIIRYRASIQEGGAL